MIAGVKGSAVSSALLILLPWNAWAADDMAGAVRELARKTIAFAGRGEPVTVSWRNVSTMSPGDSGQVQAAFEGALREAGTRVSEIAPILEARITLSANTTQFLLVEEARKGEERQVWIASWNGLISGTSKNSPGPGVNRRTNALNSGPVDCGRVAPTGVAGVSAVIGTEIVPPSYVPVATGEANGFWALMSFQLAPGVMKDDTSTATVAARSQL